MIGGEAQKIRGSQKEDERGPLSMLISICYRVLLIAKTTFAGIVIANRKEGGPPPSVCRIKARISRPRKTPYYQYMAILYVL
jgi:hypothetical protein